MDASFKVRVEEWDIAGGLKCKCKRTMKCFYSMK
jgi:hypothetical protein